MLTAAPVERSNHSPACRCVSPEYLHSIFAVIGRGREPLRCRTTSWRSAPSRPHTISITRPAASRRDRLRSVKSHLVCLDAVGQAVEKTLPVAAVEEDVPPIVPASGNVIDSTLVFNSKRSSHTDRL